MPNRINTKPAAVEVYWKYRLESMQVLRRGTTMNSPSLDSDGTIAGIQNEGLIPVDFIPSAEQIDLYYKPLNEGGLGPAVKLVPTNVEFELVNNILKNDTDMRVRGDAHDVASIKIGDILEIDDELIVIERLSPIFNTTLHNNLVAFWRLNEDNGERSNIYDLYPLVDFAAANPVGNAAGPQAGINAAAFTGGGGGGGGGDSALHIPYVEPLSLGGTDRRGFTVSCWVYLAAKGSDRTIISRWGSTAARRQEFFLQYHAASDRFQFQVIDDDNAATITNLSSTFSPVLNTWYFLCGWFDPLVSELRFSVNNANYQRTARVGNSPQTSIDTVIGARLNEISSLDIQLAAQLSGRVANVGFWRRTLSADERSELYGNYVIGQEPQAHIIFETRGAHGSDPAPHNANAPIVRIRPTVPSNSIIMDALTDPGVPGSPDSFKCVASGDDAEIGVQVVVTPPITGSKTINRIRIQASTFLWPANIEHTTGVVDILSGPAVGTIKQGGRTLTTAADLSGSAEPYSLYTYESIDVDTGVIVGPYAYAIESIVGDTITIDGTFNINKGKFGDVQDVNFFVFRAWFDAPQDYVVNDVPLVTPPAGDVFAHEPFQKFYKTTKQVYMRAQYISRRGAGPWMYWDNVAR